MHKYAKAIKTLKEGGVPLSHNRSSYKLIVKVADLLEPKVRKDNFPAMNFQERFSF